VIPAFHCAGSSDRAIRSVLAQSRPADEIIVVDDASTDSLREVVQPPVRYVRHEVNRGAAAARNTGARLSDADYLVFLDADDALAPDAIEKMHRAVESTVARWCITDVHRIEYGKTFLWRSKPPKTDALAAILAADFVMVGIFFRRTDFEEVGGYDETLRARNDWDLNIRMIRAGKRFCYIPEPLYQYYRREGSITEGTHVVACTKRILDKHHRKLAPQSKAYRQAYGAALWLLGKRYWHANHRFAAVYYCLASLFLERDLQRPRRFLTRLMGRVTTGY
jgi:glycosyltransferase involved in cell wall biosynthesis